MTPDARHDAQTLLDVLPLPSFIYDLDRMAIIGANLRFCELLGCRYKELNDKDVLELYPVEERPEVKESILSAPPEGIGTRRYQHRDGTVVSARVRYRNTEFMTAGREFLRARLVVVTDKINPAQPAATDK